MESHMKEVAGMLSCGLASIVEVLKEKLATYDWMDDLHNQREKDLKRIQELQTNVPWLNFEKGLLNKQVQDEKKKKELEERAVNHLEKANWIVNRVFKLDTTVRIQKDVIKDFSGEGDKNYHCIFDAVTKFAKDVDKSFTKFKDALLPLASNLRALSSLKPESRVRYHKLEDSNQVKVTLKCKVPGELTIQDKRLKQFSCNIMCKGGKKH
jgi:hypothetical protein